MIVAIYKSEEFFEIVFDFWAFGDVFHNKLENDNEDDN